MLRRLLEPRADATYALLRVIAGLLFSVHGVQKLFGVWTDHPASFGTQMWFGGMIELVTGIAIAFGAFTVWAAFLASGTMAVAYVQFHWRFQFDSHFLPVVNRGEPALVYSLLFLYVACHGGGPFSIDRWARGRRHSSSA